ncbi:MAG: response regulator transcription factor [Hyphomonas sp.]|uniref:response regulator transcription factor n=1 Tax=Hyphomonas sp. TaxID=87 RepID=UPI00184B3C8A|nr:response regulator transcription factor [Hyphomonas sp.]MBA3069237.1 response regulator transcription factor [Hyphomonas sp.]MBU4061816.1 response regulator transcription factor [Alphaproteobacteria bacterium]MBU4163352.1 response regulator transcription factor [Alphaproteobacteria bacterium]
MRLLLVEDNRRLGTLVGDGLRESGYAVDWVTTIDEALAVLETTRIDLVLLDLGLPDGDGIDLIRRLRAAKKMTPVLILTARSGLNDRIAGLDSGADDFLVKPFAIEELSARCRALLRRPDRGLQPLLTLGNVVLNPVERTVSVGEDLQEFRRKEVDLLEVLLRRAGHVVPRPVLEDSMYGMNEDVSSNALEAVVSRLRRHLKQSGATVEIRTIHGVGYSISKQPILP